MSSSVVPEAGTRDRQVDQLKVRSFVTREELGRVAAGEIAAELRARLARQAAVRMVFASAPSQSDVIDALAAEPGIDWHRVTAFHMDEYIGLAPDAPERFGSWLSRYIFDRLPFAAVHPILPGSDPEATARDYAALLAEAPIDIVQLGIGVNGHIAFNDPPVADFNDPLDVKVVELDEVCRQQQVDDDCFATLADVPLRAITLTVPRLLRADRLFCMVPGERKRNAVRATLEGPLSTDCPASILRTHPDCTLYLDAESDPHA
ncbi:MAG TPA: glucosamine-6-phosphate deaminase [Devosia sp.]|jgi:glucosamine-6-phosphate deaminase|uniref:glucosamine-6-phosphate deaminase n=1 Tax=Devosia sp. TaxID=1871048 RepID=UPI002DDDB4E5|nr:glucosamine-6-phosphate deaminase [Devosia sp.]HEV2518416.1 glucosamine-6-phosphate deaminase [Devosia sp.]